ncbi:hypothetical protein UlMin_008816 [Ulmus minor]
MKPYTEPVHIKKYAGKRVGIDAYSWLHKGAYSCSMELCLNSDSEKKLRYIDYFMHRINLLRHYKITPVVVFDGGNVPCKASTEQERHRRRVTNRDLAMEKLKEGNVTAASEYFQKAVSVTPSMAHQLIQILRSENIEFVVAPYEADAQLAYLSSLKPEKGGIVAVITEDSDLLAFGCPAIVFKMDRYGSGEEILLGNVFYSETRTPSFKKFDKELFTGMCVLAGCDFLPSVPGIGIAKSYALVSKYQNLDRVISVLKLGKKNRMPEDYPKLFREAVSVFQHAQIYDPDMKKLKHMRPLAPQLLQSLDGQLDFLGPEIPPSMATAIAEGKVDPISLEAFDSSPSSRYHTHPEPIRIQTSGRLPRVEAAKVSAKEGCFLAFSSPKIIEKDYTEEETPVSSEAKYLNKVEVLQRLILPSTTQEKETIEIPVVPKSTLEFPDNNPFKRRKFDETNSMESSDIFSLSPGYVTLDQIPDDDACRKRKLNETTLCREEQISEVSVVTLEENSDKQCMISDSQKSVNSKLNKITSGKKKGKNEKLKNSSSKSSDAKKTSILNFFSRV